MGKLSLMILKTNTNHFKCNKISSENFCKFFFDQTLVLDAAHKKGSGSTKNGRDSVSKRRGVKVYGRQLVLAGGVIVRQVGKKFTLVIMSDVVKISRYLQFQK